MIISILSLVSSLLAWKKLNRVPYKHKAKSSSLRYRLTTSKKEKKLDERLKEVEYISRLRDQIADRNVYRRAGKLLQFLAALEKDLSHPGNTEKDKEKLQAEIERLIRSIKGELQLTNDYEGLIKELNFLEEEKRKLRGKKKL